MANRHYEHALKGLPCPVSTTAHLIYQVICYRFDDRPTMPNGKPNRGYLKSYPGMADFMSATGLQRGACNTAIESLIANNLIVRITIGKPGSRAEYRPVYTLNALNESVPNTRHVSKEYKPRKLADNVMITNTKSTDGVANVLSPLDTISTISNHKYEKLITLLPSDISQYIKPGKNLDKLLDKLVDQGMSIEEICAHLSGAKYSDRYSIGGTVVTHLEALLGVKRPSDNGWCGMCDDGTRQFVGVSPGVDGKDTHQCPTCHPNQIRIKQRLKSDGDLDTMLTKLAEFDTDKLLKSFGKVIE